jgi:hypothetical protein
MSTHKNSVPYTASDIEKYRKGNLSAREMYELEQAALDDPFLADAIEGLTQHPILQEDLTDLHERLEAKLTRETRRNRIINIRRRSALAAALLLLLGIGYTFFYHHPDLPRAAQPPQSEARAAADSVTIHYTPPATTPATAAVRHHLPATAARRALASNQYATLPPSNQPPPTSPSNQPPPTSDKKFYLNPTPAVPDPAKAESEEKSKSGLRIQKDTTTYFALQAVGVRAPVYYSGKVLDLQDHPLAGAFLALNDNSGFGTTTDDQGQFRISLHPFDTTRQLTVSMIGYDHTSLAVNALSPDGRLDNIIRLKPSTTNLDEVVIVGYGIHQKETEVAAPSDDSDEKVDTLWSNATPVIGRLAYLQYLDLAKKKLSLDSTITGTETLSFIVSRDGSLSSYKIERSLSPAHDAGIIRLVTDGPAWHLIRGKKVRASVTINF